MRIAVIGCGAMGSVYAAKLGAAGSPVLAVDRSDLVNEVVEEIKAAKGKAVAFQADLETYAGAQAVVAEALILLVSVILRPDFLKIEINTVTGMLYGVPIDILNRSAEITIIAMGMTVSMTSPALPQKPLGFCCSAANSCARPKAELIAPI